MCACVSVFMYLCDCARVWLCGCVPVAYLCLSGVRLCVLVDCVPAVFLRTCVAVCLLWVCGGVSVVSVVSAVVLWRPVCVWLA